MNRRDFFRRTVPAVAIAAVAAPAVAMALGQPKRDAAGRIIVDGNAITLDGLNMPGEGLSIRAAGPITVQNCLFTSTSPAPALTFVNA